MNPGPADITVLPPRPDFDDDDLQDPTQEPWVTTAADLVAYLLDGAAPELVATGNADIDGPLGGLAPGTLTAVVAAPGPAATAAVAAAAHHVAYHHHLATLFYPLRCTAAAIADHLAQAHADAQTGSDGLAGAVADLRACPLYVGLGSPITVSRIMADALDDDIDPPRLIVVDAVSLLHPGGTSRDLKHLALELNVAVLCSTTVAVRAGVDVTVDDAPADIAACADTIVALAAARPAARRARPQPLGALRAIPAGTDRPQRERPTPTTRTPDTDGDAE